MKKPHDDDYSKQERKLLAMTGSMIQVYAGVFDFIIYQHIVTSPASLELLISFAMFVAQLCFSWDVHICVAENRLLTMKCQVMT
jgi:hypothetical protein